MAPPKAFNDLHALSVQIHTLNSILALLHWDQETFMPQGAITQRSAQIAELSSMIHQKKTSRKFKTCLEKLVSLSSGKIKVKGLSKQQKIMVREWLKDFLRMDKLPSSFVKEFSQVTAEASQIWSTAKNSNQFQLFAPFLQKIVDLSLKKAELLGYEEHPYDALLQMYEPCMSVKKIKPLFQDLKKELTALLKKIEGKKQIDARFLQKKVPLEKQTLLGEFLLSKLPMDANYSRLDFSSHPFSTALHPHDSRITTRILPNNFMSNLSSILHEVGHSLYEMGLSTDTWGTPLSEAASLSVHESQSRWWETLIGRSYPFWKGLYPSLKKQLPSLLKNVSLEQFYKGFNQVKPSYIRVEADELTYCLHVILRFEIEEALISKKLQVHELPYAWNQKMEELFGIVPPTDTEGCLQDIHWSLGDFGYFPTYALGNILAAQFFTSFQKEFPDWEEKVASGDFVFIRDWLKTNIHIHGRAYTAEELVKKVTGSLIKIQPYCSYLKKKYGKIYKLR